MSDDAEIYDEAAFQAEMLARRKEHAKTPWVIEDRIMRFDREDERPGSYTYVGRDQMLIEILHAVANAEQEQISVTVNYIPGPTEAERRSGAHAHPGRHSVSLWREEYDAERDEWRNQSYVTFLFGTSPDVMFWNGI